MAVERRFRGCRATILLVVCHVSLLHPTLVAADQPTRCLNPAAEHAVKGILDAGTLQAILADNGLTLTDIGLKANRIEVRATNGGGSIYGVDLVAGESRHPSDGLGKTFVFHLHPTSAPQDTAKVLLAAAHLIDRAIPDTGFTECAGQSRSPPPAVPQAIDGLRKPQPYPRSFALFSAMVQVLVLLAATVFGWRALPSTGTTTWAPLPDSGRTRAGR